MSGLKTIRRRISSVKNTKQITRAMKLVSAAKLKRAQEAAENGAVFSEKLDALVGTLIRDIPEGFSHPLLEVRDEVRVRRVVVIAGERGLCGAYNANVVKAVQNEIRTSRAEIEVVPIGKRSVAAAKRMGWNIATNYDGLPEDAARWPIDEIAATLIRDFEEAKCDEVTIFYTRFVSALNQSVTREELLPLRSLLPSEEPVASGHTETATSGGPRYSPAPEQILYRVVPLLVKTKLYKAGLQSKASEHAARMTAMDAATNNANDLIEKLRLYYNRARQSTITRELIDIVGGAEAIK